VEFLPERVPYLRFNLEPMIGIIVLFLTLGLFRVCLWFPVIFRRRDHLDVFVRDLGV
jgi:hypothetical protein